METNQPLFDLNKIAKNLIESNNHVDWSGVEKQINPITDTKGATMGELRFLSNKGDTRVLWDPTNVDEVEAAKAQFDTLKKKGFKAFLAGKDGSKGKLMAKFKKTAGRIIMVPAIAGG